MIGRFGLSGSSNQTPAAGGAPPNTASAPKKMSSISSISSMTMSKMKLTDITKKVSAGLNIPMGVDQDRRAKLEAEERKGQIVQVLTILEDVYLQAPASHSGLILTYYGRTLSPVMSPGIKFTWFRMCGEDKVDQLEESSRAWYAPTADDIGCMICVQCEDNFDQGCSRYLECGPIRADQLLCSAVEAVLDYGVHESKDVCVSLGLSVGELHTASSESGLSLATVLDRDLAFLQLNGRSLIEVDEQGIFISIPTFHPVTSVTKGQAGKEPNGKTTFNTSRRGLRLPASPAMSVSCSQPTALVIRVPITRTNAEGEAEAAHGHSGDDEKMRQFLNSSILAIPWTYEGHNLSPAAYIAENESRLSPEERERITKEAEADSIIFANTVCALTEFISSLPDGTTELHFCFHCVDRHSRDVLACSARALACFPETSTRSDRKKALRWLPGADEEVASLVADTESDQELRKRVKAMEAETMELKRERNELMNQLLAAREDLSAQKHHAQANISASGRPQMEPSTFASEGSEPHVTTNSAEASDSLPESRDVLSKIIELENKLSISLKKEAELVKVRADLEGRTSKLTVEAERSKRQVDDLQSKVTTLQALHDRQAMSLQTLEDLHVKTQQEVEDCKKKCHHAEAAAKEAAQKDIIIAELHGQIEELRATTARERSESDERYRQLCESQAVACLKSKQQDMLMAQMEIQLSTALAEGQRLQREKLVLEETIKTQEAKLLEVAKLEAQLCDAEARISRLSGEMNHLQKKSESQTRDLKKMMVDNASTVAEFEKALVRKSEECNDLYFKINALKDQEAVRAQADIAQQGLLSKLSARINLAGDGEKSSEGATRRLSTSANLMFRRLSGADRIPMSTSGHEGAMSDNVNES